MRDGASKQDESRRLEAGSGRRRRGAGEYLVNAWPTEAPVA